jgi:DNA-binding GntR family transcriptional regulator
MSPPEMLLRQHQDIFDALEKRDADAVDNAMTPPAGNQRFCETHQPGKSRLV